MDRSSQAQSIEALRREQERLMVLAPGQEHGLLEAILRHSPHGVIVCDADGKLVLYNVAAERIWAGSASAESVGGWSSYRAFHPDGRPFNATDWSMARCLSTRETIGPEEIQIERFDGTRAVLLGSAAPIIGADGQLEGGLAVFADITRWKHLEASTEAAHLRASFLSEAGTILLSSALHLHEMLERAASLVVQRVADGCVIEVEGEQAIVAHRDPEVAARLRAIFRGGETRPAVRLSEHVALRPLRVPQVDDAFWASLTADATQREALGALHVSSLMLAPVRARGVSIGAICLWTSESERAYDDADAAMIERFAQKAALAIDAVRLYRAERDARARVERAAERARRIQTITTDLASALSSKRVAEAVVDQGVAAVGAQTGGLWLVERDGQSARALRTLGFSPEAEQRFGVLPIVGRIPVADAIRSAEPIVIESRAEYEARYPESVEHFRDIMGFDHFAVAVLPLVLGQAAIGAITFTWKEERRIDDDERAFLRLIAAHCSQGLVRAQLYDAERKARTEVALLYRLVDGASQAVTLEQVYELALDVIQRALDAERTSILLFDPDGVIRFKAWRGLSDSYREMVEGYSPWAANDPNPQLVVVPDVEADPAFASSLPALRSERIRALAFVPLVHRNKLLGKLMIYGDAPRELLADEQRLAHSIATEVAHAIARKQGEAEIVRLFADAQAARSAAEAASRMKDEFLGVVSHELRTPLSAILGWAGILKNDPDTTRATREKGIAAIERNARAQLKIIEDILDVSRIISGKLVIDPRPTGLLGLLTEAVDAVRASATAKNISLQLTASEDPHTISCDPERVRQVIWNLLSNAIKFTPRGGSVRLELAREANAIAIRVRDTGPGISPEFLPHVFERFRQADSSTTRAQTGLGLGLAIVRHLVELHGGQVRADSPGLGLGATFTVTLPIHGEHEAAHAPEPASDEAAHELSPRAAALAAMLAEVRVLVVDDDRDAREMLEHVLCMHGAQVQVAASARDAIELIHQFHPHVLVSDIGMPAEDGYTLIRLVRALPQPDSDLRAIAFTAYARPLDRRIALAAGYDEHVSKPLNIDVFPQLVAELSKRDPALRDAPRS